MADAKEPLWIDERDALTVHSRLIALYGGADGVRDHGLLNSALARPRQHYTYSEGPDVIGLAATYAAGIIRNHPFIDGNKRTGFVISTLFLELNNYHFTATEEDATTAVMALAAGTLDEIAFTTWLRANTEPATPTK